MTSPRANGERPPSAARRTPGVLTRQQVEARRRFGVGRNLTSRQLLFRPVLALWVETIWLSANWLAAGLGALGNPYRYLGSCILIAQMHLLRLLPFPTGFFRSLRSFIRKPSHPPPNHDVALQASPGLLLVRAAVAFSAAATAVLLTAESSRWFAVAAVASLVVGLLTLGRIRHRTRLFLTSTGFEVSNVAGTWQLDWRYCSRFTVNGRAVEVHPAHSSAVDRIPPGAIRAGLGGKDAHALADLLNSYLPRTQPSAQPSAS